MNGLLFATHTKQKSTSMLKPASNLVQAKAHPSGIRENNNFQNSLNSVLNQDGKALSGQERTFFESRFGYDFSKVRLHDQNQAATAARQINAQAFTLGSDIVLESGRQSPLERKELLAHELTHVVQQSKDSGVTGFSLKTEKEADRNSKMISDASRLSVGTSSPAGVIQRKPKGKVSVENSGTKKSKDDKPAKNENKYSFSAETEVPLPGNRKYGKFNFLNDLSLKISGEKSSEEPISGPVDLETLKIKIALELAKLELEKIKNTRFGEFKAGAKLGADTSFTLKYGKGSGKEGEAGTSGGFNLSYKTPNALPGRLGSLTAESKLSGSGSLTGTAGGEESKFTPKVSGSAGLNLKYSSRAFKGGLLGDKATVDMGAGAEISGNISNEKRGMKAGGSGEIGITGKGKGGRKRFIKIKITGDVSLDQKAGEAKSRTSSVMIGGFIGGSF